LAAWEGTSILYRDNSFVYILRETTSSIDLSHADSIGISSDGVVPRIQDASNSEYGDNNEDNYSDYQDASNFEYGDNDEDNYSDYEGDADLCQLRALDDEKINIPKFGHLIRHIKIQAEPNRSGPEYRATMASAIRIFADLAPLKANIRTISLEVFPNWYEDPSRAHVYILNFIDFFEPHSDVIEALLRLPCQEIKVIVNTPEGGEFDIVVNRKYQTWIRRANRGDDSFALLDHDLASHRQALANAEARKLQGIADKIYAKCAAEYLNNPEDQSTDMAIDVDMGSEA
jgi:hypothetical protein